MEQGSVTNQSEDRKQSVHSHATNQANASKQLTPNTESQVEECFWSVAKTVWEDTQDKDGNIADNHKKPLANHIANNPFLCDKVELTHVSECVIQQL